MSPNEFFYWLQGYFELRDEGTAPLTSDQATCIMRHAQLVRASGHDLGKSLRLIEIEALVTKSEEARVIATEEIQRVLAAQFEHVIDPQAGDAKQQEVLNAIHNGGSHGGTGSLVCRC